MKVVVSDRRGVAHQRNLGAQNSTTEHLLFLDADSRLHDEYISDMKEENEKNKADISTAHIWPDSKNPLDWFFWLGGNMVIDVSRYTYPFAPGMNIYITKDLFEKIEGFNEEYKVGEDSDLVKRAVGDGGKFVVLKKAKYFTDVRRLKAEGHMGYLVKLMLIAWQAYNRGSFAKVDIEYKMGDWDEYEKQKENEKKSLLEKVKKTMLFWRE